MGPDSINRVSTHPTLALNRGFHGRAQRTGCGRQIDGADALGQWSRRARRTAQERRQQEQHECRQHSPAQPVAALGRLRGAGSRRF